ncbi:hypothetical protein GCM10009608_50620 [Pseudonocardia alaniniphila]
MPTCYGDRPPLAGDRRPDEGRQQEIEPVDQVLHQAQGDRLTWTRLIGAALTRSRTLIGTSLRRDVWLRPAQSGA